MLCDTHYFAVIVLAAAVGGGESGSALFQVPGLAPALRRAADADGVDGVGVPIARAVVPAAPAVARCPHKDGAAALPALRGCGRTQRRFRSHSWTTGRNYLDSSGQNFSFFPIKIPD